jgi:hypothetical protein
MTMTGSSTTPQVRSRAEVMEPYTVSSRSATRTSSSSWHPDVNEQDFFGLPADGTVAVVVDANRAVNRPGIGGGSDVPQLRWSHFG